MNPKPFLLAFSIVCITGAGHAQPPLPTPPKPKVSFRKPGQVHLNDKRVTPPPPAKAGKPRFALPKAKIPVKAPGNRPAPLPPRLARPGRPD